MYGGTFLLFFINWLNSLHLTHHVSHTTLCSSHWWHHNCLNKVLTKPPFGLQGCPKCGLRIWHHEWERDIKRLERRWAAKQARDRELNEVADSFGGLGEEFIVRRKKKIAMMKVTVVRKRIQMMWMQKQAQHYLKNGKSLFSF